MSDTTSDTSPSAEGQHAAGAFDIRNFIGALMGIFGVIVLLMGLFGNKELAKTGGVNANLWAGIALIVVAAVFMTWARLRPVVIPAHVETPEVDPTRPGPAPKPRS